MRCNACWLELEGQAISTTCGHLLCSEDASKILSNDAACPICDQVLSETRMKPVDINPNDEWINMAMAGVSPKILMESAYKSVMFYIGQKELEMQHKMDRIVVQWRQKSEAMEEKFLEKLEQVHSKGIDVTEVLDDSDEVLSDDVVRGDCGQEEEEEEKESLEQCNASIDEQRSSGIHVSTAKPALPETKPGSVQRFTSVRAASLRASGLAAHNAALQGVNCESCSIRASSQFSDQCTGNSSGFNLKVGKINQANDQGNHDENSIGLRNGVNCSVGSSTARNADSGEELHECDGGLSYTDSQEPGELSQAKALNFVERFVNGNLMEFDDEVALGKSISRKPKLISSAKGPQSLAKGTIKRSTAETKIFDWEDEGGGDFQIAAEAMETLFYGEGSTDQNPSQGVLIQSILKGSSKGLLRGESRKRVSSGEATIGNGVRCSDAAPVTRRSKKTKSSKESSVLLEKHSKNFRKECDTELLLPEMKKAKSNTD
ncbi:uncharacterized protein LOC110427567, partial [Herrania umbratica]|uniref:Uncharacterized protein LOC110427567 n=1 Tax=Herrania umbratica TaxID=108875 RepID=A0A6J1BH01_9ROSI